MSLWSNGWVFRLSADCEGRFKEVEKVSSRSRFKKERQVCCGSPVLNLSSADNLQDFYISSSKLFSCETLFI